MHEKIVGVTVKILGLSKDWSKREGKRKKDFHNIKYARKDRRSNSKDIRTIKELV